MPEHGAAGPGSWRGVAATAGGSAIALGLLVRDHLAHVDFLSFAGRARRLRDGVDLLHPLYPVGYPATLSALQVVTGDVLWAGKLLAVMAGALAVAATARLLGPLPAVWLAAQGALLQWGSTEGTDMPAAALSLAAVAAASERRAAAAGVLAGAACLCRYTGVAVVPVVLALAGRPHVVLAAMVATTAPHWATALALGRSPLPDQTENLSIAAGHATSLLSRDTLVRWPGGFGRAVGTALRQPATAVGAIGLLVGVARRDRRARGLLGLALLHLALVGLAFAKPRLVLPATLALAAGAAFLVPARWPRARWLLAPGALAVGVGALVALWPTSSVDDRRAAQAAALASRPGPFLTTDPWVCVRHAGWLLGGLPLHEAGQARALTPASVTRFAQDRGVVSLVVDRSRARRTYPGLEPLVEAEEAAGLTLVEQGAGWRVWAVDQ